MPIGTLTADNTLVQGTLERGLQQVVMLPGGGYVVGWIESFNVGDDFRRVIIQTFDAGGNKVGEDSLGNSVAPDLVGDRFPHAMPEIAPTADGGFMVAYASGYTVVAHYNAAGSRQDVAVTSTLLYSTPNIVLFENGRGLYLDNFNGRYSGTYMSADGTFGERFYPFGDAMKTNEFKTCILENGRVALAWKELETGQIITALLKGKTLGKEIAVSGDTLSSIVALDGGGYAVASYDTAEGTPGSKLTMFDDKGKRVHIESFGSTYQDGDQEPALAQLDDGRIVSASTDIWGDDNTDLGIVLNFFSAAGEGRSQIFVATAGAGTVIGRPHVAALTDDRLAVTWTTQVGSDNPVLHSQLFDPSVFNAPAEGSSWAGGDGTDKLFGGDGTDFLEGFGGNDSIHGGSNQDQLYGGIGNDMVFGDGGEDFLWGDAGRDSIYGGADDDWIFVEAKDDVIGETYDGGAGYDVLNAYNFKNGKVDLSNDQIIEIEQLNVDGKLVIIRAAQVLGFERILFAAKDNTLQIKMDSAIGTFDAGSLGLDALDGGVVRLRIVGSSAGETIAGSAYVDIIAAGAGIDTLTGGDGADTFEFIKGCGRDTITDFLSAGKFQDMIALSGIKGMDDFKSLASHIRNHGDDAWITFGKDVLVLEDVHKSELSGRDFQF